MKTSDIPTIEEWMGEKENYKWLDFGSGIQKLKAPMIRIMVQRNIHHIRIFTPDKSDKPIGIVALSDINFKFKTATLWYVLGNKTYAGKGYTTRAVKEMLNYSFKELNLMSIFAWAIEENIPSRRILENNNFQLIGKRRSCHVIENHYSNRYLYELLKLEYLKTS